MSKRELTEEQKEKRREYQREYKKKNKEKIAEYKKKYYKKNKEKLVEQQKQYYKKNKEKVAEQRAEPKSCDLCFCLKKGDTLFQMYSELDGGIGIDCISDIQYCPKCGRRLD